MTLETYYKDHWVQIEEDRLERYESMFQWRPALAPILEPADIQPGQIVGDYGCGPGFVTIELARRVGPSGHVHSFDINADFAARTRARAEAEGLGDIVTVHHITADGVPLPDDSLDRLIAKNVMVYVDDPAATYLNFKRVVKPGGKVHVADSDFRLTVVDPVPPDEWRALLDAAEHAFRTPTIGRQLYGLARRAGFSEVDVKIVAIPDKHGRMLHFTNNVAGYAREGGQMDEARIARCVEIATKAMEDGDYFAVNPQFLVTATV